MRTPYLISSVLKFFSVLLVSNLDPVLTKTPAICQHPKYVQEIAELFVKAGIDNCHVEAYTYLLDRPQVLVHNPKQSDKSTMWSRNRLRRDSGSSDNWGDYVYDYDDTTLHKDSSKKSSEKNFLTYDLSEKNFVQMTHDQHLASIEEALKDECVVTMIQHDIEFLEFIYEYYHNTAKDHLFKHLKEITKVDYKSGKLDLQQFLTLTYDGLYTLLKFSTPEEINNMVELLADHWAKLVDHDCYRQASDLKEMKNIYIDNIGYIDPTDELKNLKFLLDFFMQGLAQNNKFMSSIKTEYPNMAMEAFIAYSEWVKRMNDFRDKYDLEDLENRKKYLTTENIQEMKNYILDAFKSEEIQEFIKNVHNALSTTFEAHSQELTKHELIDSMLVSETISSSSINVDALNQDLTDLLNLIEENEVCGCFVGIDGVEGEGASIGLIVLGCVFGLVLVTVGAVMFIRRRNRNKQFIAGSGFAQEVPEFR